jgi:phosphate:Na+ symporter
MIWNALLVSAALLNAVHLVPTEDPISGRTLSGDGQAVEVGRPFDSPFRVTVLDEGNRPIPGYPVEFQVLFGDTVKRRTARSDSLGVASFLPSSLEVPGDGFVLSQADGSGLTYRFRVLRKGLSWLILIQLIGGFSLFFFGLRRGRSGLLRMAGARMRKSLFGLTRNRFLGVLGGFLSTLVLQSSTATTVMLVSFVNSSLLLLGSAIAATLGASLGTTVTAQILAFRVLDYSVLILAVGYLMEMTKGRLKPLGRFIFGFGLVFFGIKIMADGAAGLRFYPWFDGLIQSFGDQKVFGILVSTVFTGLVHSSAATLGVGLSLSFDNLIGSLDTVVILVIGANLGTCLTPLTSSLGGQPDGKRTALAYILTKVLTAALILVFFGPFTRLVGASSGDIPRQIANAHLFFNVILVLLCLPLLPVMEKVLIRLFRTTETIEGQPLSESLLDAPEMAASLAHRRILQMGDRAFFMLSESLNTFKHKELGLLHRIRDQDDQIDRYEEELTPFLTRLMEEELSSDLTRRVKVLLFAIDELEHVGDIISKNIMRYAERMYRDGLKFSSEGLEELELFHREVLRTYEMAVTCLTSFQGREARSLMKRGEIVERMKKDLHLKHLKRLARATEETLLTTTIHLDLISDLERVNFHAASIGVMLTEEGS